MPAAVRGDRAQQRQGPEQKLRQVRQQSRARPPRRARRKRRAAAQRGSRRAPLWSSRPCAVAGVAPASCWPPTTAASGWRPRPATPLDQRLARPGLPRSTTVRLAGRLAAWPRADILRAAGLRRDEPMLGPRPGRRCAAASSRSAGSRAPRWCGCLPDTVVIAVVERRPAGGLAARRPHAVVDADGDAVPEADPARFADLPLVVGDGANQPRPADPAALRAAAAADGAARRPGAGRRPALGPAAEGRRRSIQLPADRRGCGADPARPARPEVADPGPRLLADRPARSGDGGGAAAARRRAGRSSAADGA